MGQGTKRLLQVLYKRRMVDLEQVKSPHSMHYSKKGKTEDFDDEGNLTEEGEKLSLEYLMQNCTDFKAKKTDLKYLAERLVDGELQEMNLEIGIELNCPLLCQYLKF